MSVPPFSAQFGAPASRFTTTGLPPSVSTFIDSVLGETYLGDRRWPAVVCLIAIANDTLPPDDCVKRSANVRAIGGDVCMPVPPEQPAAMTQPSEHMRTAPNRSTDLIANIAFLPRRAMLRRRQSRCTNDSVRQHPRRVSTAIGFSSVQSGKR